MLDEDKKWVKGLHKGKADCLQKLFHKYHHALYYHALDFVKSPQQAEDVVQEVFVKVWEKRDQIKPELSFKAYLFCITKNHVINQLQKASREMKAKQYIAQHTIHYHNQPEEQMIFADYEAMARKALDGLPAKRKMVFTLHRIEGRKYDEIAAQLNISKHTVRDHVVKAEKSIKEYFAYQAKITISLFLALLTSLF